MESLTWPLNSHNSSENYPKTNILAHDQHYYISEALGKISDRLYIRVCTFNIIYYYQVQQVQQVPGTTGQVQQVPEKWRDTCKLPKCIKFGVVSYNN